MVYSREFLERIFDALQNGMKMVSVRALRAFPGFEQQGELCIFPYCGIRFSSLETINILQYITRAVRKTV